MTVDIPASSVRGRSSSSDCSMSTDCGREKTGQTAKRKSGGTHNSGQAGLPKPKDTTSSPVLVSKPYGCAVCASTWRLYALSREQCSRLPFKQVQGVRRPTMHNACPTSLRSYLHRDARKRLRCFKDRLSQPDSTLVLAFQTCVDLIGMHRTQSTHFVDTRR